MRMRIVFVFAVSLLFASASADDSSWRSQRGLYVASYQSELTPVQINKLHAWIIHIETASGDPVDGAVIAASGGMPVHNHGLPTRPRATAEVGEGDYRLDGMRFHMTGLWEITLVIDDGGIKDTVVISLTL